jgi:tRNA(fMet)-specific endonuclease VapC
MSFALIDTDIASFIFKGSDYADPYLPLLRGQDWILEAE